MKIAAIHVGDEIYLELSSVDCVQLGRRGSFEFSFKAVAIVISVERII